MASLGQELKKQRESRNISIEEMAASTKIVGRYLQALEDDCFEAMPGGFFVKGIIRTYAVSVGLNPNEVLARYREAGLLEEPVKAHGRPMVMEPGAPAKNRRVAAILVVAGLLVLVIVLTFVVRSRRHRPAAPSQSPPAAAVPQARPAASPPAERSGAGQSGATVSGQRPAEPAPVREAAKGLTMDISFLDDTWIQVSTDGTPKISQLFPAGGKVRAQAEREILITVLGNAGGITFLLNGQPGKALGRIGEVLNNVRITLENQKEFLQGRPPTGPAD